MNIQIARTTSADAVLLRENDGPVAVLTLNRPAARNSLSEALLGALGEALTAIARTTACARWCWRPTARRSAPATISRS